jgi:hypothetical protein
MTVLSSIAVVAAEAKTELIAPAFVFPMIAIGVFLLLGAVTWSFRDVAHRHNEKSAPPSGPHGH